MSDAGFGVSRGGTAPHASGRADHRESPQPLSRRDATPSPSTTLAFLLLPSSTTRLTRPLLVAFRATPPLRVKMDKSAPVVYLEDLEGPVNAAKENAKGDASQSSKASPSKSEASERKTQTGATKRQMTLTDMLPSGSSTAKAPATKKARATLSANPSLNSIPFSLSDFQSTFSDEEKKLLALECQTMGKSW